MLALAIAIALFCAYFWSQSRLAERELSFPPKWLGCAWPPLSDQRAGARGEQAVALAAAKGWLGELLQHELPGHRAELADPLGNFLGSCLSVWLVRE